MINTSDQIRVGRKGRGKRGRLGRWRGGVAREGGGGGEKGPEEQGTGEVGAREVTVGRMGPQQEQRADRGLREGGATKKGQWSPEMSARPPPPRPRAPIKKHKLSSGCSQVHSSGCEGK